jgi:hypothetical protein
MLERKHWKQIKKNGPGMWRIFNAIERLDVAKASTSTGPQHFVDSGQALMSKLSQQWPSFDRETTELTHTSVQFSGDHADLCPRLV